MHFAFPLVKEGALREIFPIYLGYCGLFFYKTFPSPFLGVAACTAVFYATTQRQNLRDKVKKGFGVFFIAVAPYAIARCTYVRI